MIINVLSCLSVILSFMENETLRKTEKMHCEGRTVF